MNDEPIEPNATVAVAGPPPPDAATAEAPKPNYIGQSNIIDRSQLQANYPNPVAVPPTGVRIPDRQQAANDRYDGAASAFAEAKVLICGVASSTSYLLITYLVKNVWVIAIVSAILAFAAIFFAVSDYRKNSRTSPLTVVGLSAATITLVYIANILLALAVIHSAASSFMY